MALILVGDDWAEDHHDIHPVDAPDARLASRRLPEGIVGIRAFHELVAIAKGDSHCGCGGKLESSFG